MERNETQIFVWFEPFIIFVEILLRNPFSAISAIFAVFALAPLTFTLAKPHQPSKLKLEQ
jgi:hypothetical protein